MKKIALATTVLSMLFAAGAASAADLAARPYTKAPPPVLAPIYNWTGFYIGVNGGYGTSHKCWDNVGFVGVPLVALSEGCHDSDGGTVGGQIGYRWQASNWVFGLEAQGNWADFSGSNNSLVFPGLYNRTRIDAFGFFTGQIGYSWNNALLYVKGGAAAVHDKYTSGPIGTGLVTASADETRWGGVVGVGFEYGFAPNWSFGVEYDHAFLGRRDITLNQVVAPFPVESIRQDLDVVTARINYRFGGPVVAKY